ncbi:carbon storage regulator [Microbulbifer sp. SSSA007]|uniref:carbon storage regulator n=1 Tax=Microbulbifer sp. SSSA007 TaxID=3243379 RepID=UPI00403A653B
MSFSRKQTGYLNENLRIGTNLSITMLEVKSNQVKIGIHALKSLPASRKEVYERIGMKDK